MSKGPLITKQPDEVLDDLVKFIECLSDDDIPYQRHLEFSTLLNVIQKTWKPTWII